MNGFLKSNFIVDCGINNSEICEYLKASSSISTIVFGIVKCSRNVNWNADLEIFEQDSSIIIDFVSSGIDSFNLYMPSVQETTNSVSSLEFFTIEINLRFYENWHNHFYLVDWKN